MDISYGHEIHESKSKPIGILNHQIWDDPSYIQKRGTSLAGWWFQPTPLKNVTSSVGMIFHSQLNGKS